MFLVLLLRDCLFQAILDVMPRWALRALGTLFMDGSVVDHLLDGWLCSWSLAPFVLLPFLLASYDLPCSSDGFAAPHIHPIVSISLGDLPRTCTSDMHLGHVPWTCTLDMHLGCHVPYLVPPWGMHAAPWTSTSESNVGSEDTLGATLFGDASAEG